MMASSVLCVHVHTCRSTFQDQLVINLFLCMQVSLLLCNGIFLVINKIAYRCFCVEQQELMFTELNSKLKNTEQNLQTVNECEGS